PHNDQRRSECHLIRSDQGPVRALVVLQSLVWEVVGHRTHHTDEAAVVAQMNIVSCRDDVRCGAAAKGARLSARTTNDGRDGAQVAALSGRTPTRRCRSWCP